MTYYRVAVHYVVAPNRVNKNSDGVRFFVAEYI